MTVISHSFLHLFFHNACQLVSTTTEIAYMLHTRVSTITTSAVHHQIQTMLDYNREPVM